MKYFPIFLNLHDKKAVVIGGGEVALRKVNDLLEAGALVTVIAPRLHEDLRRICGKNPFHIERKYMKGDLEGAFLAFSATDDPNTNRLVFEEAREHGILLNSVDDPENCNFIIPSTFARGDLVIAVSTSGASPSLAAKIRRRIEESLPAHIEEALEALRLAREILKKNSSFASLTSSERGRLLKEISSDDQLLGALLQHHKTGTIGEFLSNLLQK